MWNRRRLATLVALVGGLLVAFMAHKIRWVELEVTWTRPQESCAENLRLQIGRSSGSNVLYAMQTRLGKYHRPWKVSARNGKYMLRGQVHCGGAEFELPSQELALNDNLKVTVMIPKLCKCVTAHSHGQ